MTRPDYADDDPDYEKDLKEESKNETPLPEMTHKDHVQPDANTQGR